MLFQTLGARLLDHIRARVISGEVTERGLARLAGLSQPHLHNVLKGERSLSIEMADQIMRRLRITLLDLIEEQDLAALWPPGAAVLSRYREVPVLEGAIGPGNPYPLYPSLYQRCPFPRFEVASLIRPAVARVTDDPPMRHLFRAHDLVLLDEADTRRLAPVLERYYALATVDGSMIRRVSREGPGLRAFTSPAAAAAADVGVYISLADRHILDVVRARVFWIGRYLEHASVTT